MVIVSSVNRYVDAKEWNGKKIPVKRISRDDCRQQHKNLTEKRVQAIQMR